MSTMSIYTDNGYANRKEYLKELGEEYGQHLVNAVAMLLGPEEDFDGLITTLEDYRDSGVDENELLI